MLVRVQSLIIPTLRAQMDSPGQQSPLVFTNLTHTYPLNSPRVPKLPVLGCPETYLRRIFDSGRLKDPQPNYFSFLFLFYIQGTSISVLMPRSTKASCCLFSPQQRLISHQKKKKCPRTYQDKSLLASSTSNLTEECFAFTIKQNFKEQVSVYFNLRKQVRQHCWDFFFFPFLFQMFI